MYARWRKRDIEDRQRAIIMVPLFVMAWQIGAVIDLQDPETAKIFWLARRRRSPEFSRHLGADREQADVFRHLGADGEQVDVPPWFFRRTATPGHSHVYVYHGLSVEFLCNYHAIWAQQNEIMQ